jgi:FkbM family methyltransferase
MAMSLAHRVRKGAGDVLERVAPHYMHHRRLRLAAPAEQEIELLPALCEPGKIAIDVGANKGLYVDHLRALGANVVAFEPYPHTAQQLQRFYRGSVNVQDVALSDKRGRAQLRLPKDNVSWATLADTNRLEMADPARGFEILNVEARTLDEYDFRDVSFIKIDVEGHEEAVLKGAQRTLTTNRPCLLIEIEERHNTGSVDRVAKMLAALGYREYFLMNDELHGYQHFDANRHQASSNVGERGKTGTYVNNFVFVHQARATNVLDKLRARGLKVL